MNKEKFITYLENPSGLNENSLPFIDEIITSFPYFQTAQALYAKNLNNLKSIHYNTQLKKAAAYSANRKVLYHLLMHEHLTTNIQKAQNEINELHEKTNLPIKEEKDITTTSKDTKLDNHEVLINEDPSSLINTTQSESIIKPKKTVNNSENNKETWDNVKKDIEAFLQKFNTEKEVKPEITHSDSSSVDEKALIDSRILDNEDEDRIEKQIKEPISKQEFVHSFENTELNTLEKEILSEAISASIEIDIHSSLSIDIEEETTNTNKKTALTNTEPQYHNITEPEKVIIPIETHEDKPSNSKTENHSFGEWLKIISSRKNPENLPLTNSRIKENEEPPVNTKPKHEKNSAYEETKNVSTKDTKSISSAIINKFIKEDPKITRPHKTEFFSPVNMARLSVVEDLSFVTETLAKIYEKQGNYSKAIIAYENLILKFPEKSTYFAARIKAIKEIKDNNK